MSNGTSQGVSIVAQGAGLVSFLACGRVAWALELMEKHAGRGGATTIEKVFDALADDLGGIARSRLAKNSPGALAGGLPEPSRPQKEHWRASPPFACYDLDIILDLTYTFNH